MTINGVSAAVIAKLQTLFGPQNVIIDEAERWSYGYDNSRRQALPDAVVFATNHIQIKSLIQLCNEHRIPLIARGRGSGTTGATVPINGGIVLSLEKMNQKIEIDADNRIAIVHPGVTNQCLQDAAAKHGLFWPPDPTSAAFSTIGGNLAYNSAGPRAVKYGTPRENVLGLSGITGEGNELVTGTYTTKGVVGYDLTRLIIGSEGTLAIITEAILKLTPLPESKRLMQAIYKDIESAAQAVSNIMKQPFVPCALEFIDGNAINMIRDFSNVIFPDNAGAMLMIEIDGPAKLLEDGANKISYSASNSGLLSFTIANTEEETAELWATRKALSPALRKVAPKKINEDVVVPVSKIPALIKGLKQLSETHQVKIVNFGHAGNGNIHVNLLIDPDDPVQAAAAEKCLDQVFDLVIELQGSLSGEHGVGLEKRDYIYKEISPNSLHYMRQLKALFDPNHILNPGKMFPTE